MGVEISTRSDSESLNPDWNIHARINIPRALIFKDFHIADLKDESTVWNNV